MLERLEAVKEQILIRYLELGLNDAHCPWLEDGVHLILDELFKHLIEMVISLFYQLEVVPIEALLTLSPNIVT